VLPLSGDCPGNSNGECQMITYRAAYVVAPQNSTSGGYCLTCPEHSKLSVADLIAAAMPALAEYNENAEAIGEEGVDASKIVIGDWRE